MEGALKELWIEIEMSERIKRYSDQVAIGVRSDGRRTISDIK
ncbi:hypothetical protein PO124_04750 [Bacillus licheniformis]|nr:hypothetical protein [Bacillus licheniformis]